MPTPPNTPLDPTAGAVGGRSLVSCSVFILFAAVAQLAR